MIDAALRLLIAEAVAPLTAEVRELRKVIEQRENEAPWTTRQELAEQLGVHIDTVDAKSRPGGDIERRMVGRRVMVRLRPRATESEVAAAAARALA